MGLKVRLQAWKGALKSKRWRVKTKIMISSENAGKVTEESKFSSTVCRKTLDSNFILQ